MSSVSGTSSYAYDNSGVNQTRTASSARQSTTETAAGTKAQSAARDVVEISEEARTMLNGATLSEEAANARWTPMGPAKTLEKGSDAEKDFRELMKRVKSQKSDVMSEIESKLKKAGISLAGKGKLKLEVDSQGKIVAGGLKDKKLARAVEEALNEDKSLGKKIKEFQRDEAKLSQQLKEYTGCSLYELTMTARGDVNQRVRETMEELRPGEAIGDDFYMALGFLGDSLGSVVSAEDVNAIGFGGMIDFSGEVTTKADPEGTIKESMEDMFGKVKEKFDAINADLIATMKERGVEIDQEFMETYLLNPNSVVISIDNHGGVTVDGMFAKDQRTHDKGMDIVRQMVQEMLNETEDNSYHINKFTSASENMLEAMAEEMGLDDKDVMWDAKVVAQITNGRIGEAKVSAPKAEADTLKAVQDGVNDLIAGAGIQLAEPLEIEVDEAGKIRAVNLQEGGKEAEQVRELLNKLNSQLERTDPAKRREEEEKEAEEEKAGEKHAAFGDWSERVAVLAKQLDRLATLRKG